MLLVPHLAPFVDAEMKLLAHCQEVHALHTSQNGQDLLHRAQPQPVSVLQSPGHGPFVIVKSLVSLRAGLADPAGPLDDCRHGLVSHVLLEHGKRGRKLLFLFDCPPLELVDEADLLGREIAETGHGAPTEEVGQVGLDVDAGDGVDEAEIGGRAASGDPEERILPGSAPRGGKERRRVAAGKLQPLLHVRFEAADGLVGEAGQLGVVSWGGV